MRSFIPIFVAALTLTLGVSAPAQLTIPSHLLLDNMAVGSSLDTDAEDSRDIAFANFDRSPDGSLDIYVVNQNQPNSLYVNDGFGVFTKSVAAGSVITDVSDSRGVALGDVEPDGDLDIFICNSSGQANSLYLNDGLGVFTKVLVGDIVTDIANSRHAIFFDANMDGSVDLFVVNFNGQDNFLYMNNNDLSGTFTKVTDALNDAVHDGGISYDMALADINGDKHIDLYVANHDGILGGSGTANFLYLNDGNGLFTRVVDATNDATTDVFNSLGATFGDFDNDGDFDLFVANDEGDKNNFYTNDGTGKFTSILVGPLVQDTGNSIFAEFVDIDGRLKEDLFVANRVTGADPMEANCLFMNNGRGGGFGMSPQGFGPLEPVVGDLGDSYGFAFGDLDGDGLIDIGVANFGSVNTIYRNMGRQWDPIEMDPSSNPTFITGSLGRPFLNGSGTLEGGTPVSLAILDGPPSGAATIFLSLNAPIFAPFKGGIFVPAPDFAISSIPLDLSGDVTIVGNMPALPPGLTFFAQAWMADLAASTGQGATSTAGLSMTTP